jgi:hypothetical protein
MALMKLKVKMTATEYFQNPGFDGLDEQTISVLSPALEQCKTIERFANRPFAKVNLSLSMRA